MSLQLSVPVVLSPSRVGATLRKTPVSSPTPSVWSRGPGVSPGFSIFYKLPRDINMLPRLRALVRCLHFRDKWPSVLLTERDQARESDGEESVQTDAHLELQKSQFHL